MVIWLAAAQEIAQTRAFDHHAGGGCGEGGIEQGSIVLRGADQLVEKSHFFFYRCRFAPFGVHRIEIHHLRAADFGGQARHIFGGIGVVQGEAGIGFSSIGVEQGAGQAVGQEAVYSGMPLENMHVQPQTGQNKTIAAEPAGGIPHGGLLAAADCFGQQLAAAVQPPVLRRAGGEIYPHGAFVAHAVQYDALLFGGQVEAGGRRGIGDSQCGMAGIVGQGVWGGGDEQDGVHGGLLSCMRR